MRSNYRRIGDYIQLVDERNHGHQVKQLLGLSISKQFIPSVANIIGTDMENYKIIRKNQFACSTMQVRRDRKMPVALLREVDEAIISQAYPVFRVVDEKKLLPDYLMMWFTRSEFDREACFHAVGGVRGSLEWEDFTELKFPVPSIDKQREIVKEYNVIQDRISLNQKLIQKLEETAQAIYKQWFVEFEFPFDFAQGKPEIKGQPYKTHGGEMVWDEELGKEIPKGWEVGGLKLISNKIYSGGTPSTEVEEFWNGEYYWFSSGETGKKYILKTEKTITKEGIKNSTTKKAKVFSTLIATAGQGKTRGQSALVYNELYINQSVIAVEPLIVEFSFYIFLNISSRYEELRNDSDAQSIRGSINSDDIKDLLILVPAKNVITRFHYTVLPLFQIIKSKMGENQKLTELKALLLSKLATVDG